MHKVTEFNAFGIEYTQLVTLSVTLSHLWGAMNQKLIGKIMCRATEFNAF